MKQTIKQGIIAIIFVATLSLMTFAQSSAWVRMMNQGISNVNDVDLDHSGIWITKTDGTIWYASDHRSNFVLFPAPVFAVRIAVSQHGSYIFVTTNDGRLFFLITWEQTPIWRQINRPNSFVNDVAVPHGSPSYQNFNRLWISESILTNNPQFGVISYLNDAFPELNGSFISTNSTGFSRVAIKYGNENQVWGVGFNGTVWHYDGNRWTRTSAQGMSDALGMRDGRVLLAGQQQYNGTLWCSFNDRGFGQEVGVQGFQNLAENEHHAFIVAAGYNGTLWKRLRYSWGSPCP